MYLFFSLLDSPLEVSFFVTKLLTLDRLIGFNFSVFFELVMIGDGTIEITFTYGVSNYRKSLLFCFYTSLDLY